MKWTRCVHVTAFYFWQSVLHIFEVHKNFVKDIVIHVPCSFIILYYDQQMHNYFTNYRTPTCFDIRAIPRELVIKLHKYFKCNCW